MKSTIKHLEDQSIVISVEGKVDFESQRKFKETLEKLKPQTDGAATTRFYFDFSGLEFVGSSGISHLIQTLEAFNSLHETPPLYLNMRREFQMLIKAFADEEQFTMLSTDIHPDLATASPPSENDAHWVPRASPRRRPMDH